MTSIRDKVIADIKNGTARDEVKAKMLQDEAFINSTVKVYENRKARKQSEIDTNEAWKKAGKPLRRDPIANPNLFEKDQDTIFF